MRKRKLDPSIIREGDKVRIVNPEFFVRCGYDNNHKDVCQMIQNEHGTDILKWIYEMEDKLKICSMEDKLKICSNERGLSILQRIEEFRDPDSYHKIVSALAYDYVRANKKSGSERKIYTVRIDQWKDKILTVGDISYVNTGFYYPPDGHYIYEESYYDYDPAGLNKMKTHKILRLKEFLLYLCRQGEAEISSIEACHVEKIIE